MPSPKRSSPKRRRRRAAWTWGLALGLNAALAALTLLALTGTGECAARAGAGRTTVSLLALLSVLAFLGAGLLPRQVRPFVQAWAFSGLGVGLAAFFLWPLLPWPAC